jgi:iron complex outermembrane recepter protein
LILASSGNTGDGWRKGAELMAGASGIEVASTSIVERRQVMRKVLGAFFVVLVILLSTGLHAEEAQQDPRSDGVMKEVVVTGTRFEQQIERIPANITVIEEEDIRNSNARTIPDLLRGEESIVVRDWTGNRKQVTVDLRGFGESASSNVLVLVDGRRVNEIDLSGVDWTQIPLENIERIEILRGTGSVLYGDNAVGGVINIITKIPSQELAFTAGATFGSYSLNAENFSVSGGKGQFTGSLYGSYESTHGYRENGEYRAKDVGGKILFDATDFLTLNFSGSYHSDDFGLPGPRNLDKLNTDRRGTQTPSDGGSTGDGYLNGGFDLSLAEYGQVVADVSYRKRRTTFDLIDFAFFQDFAIETYSITPKYIWNGAVFGHENRLIAGVDFYWADLDRKDYFGSRAFLFGLPTFEKDSYGLYFNNDFSILQNLILSLGARSEKADYQVTERDSVTRVTTSTTTIKEREPAYAAGLTYLYDEKSSVFFRANRSFRFPNTDELNLNYDLKPQIGRHYEAGIRHFFTPLIQTNMTLVQSGNKE